MYLIIPMLEGFQCSNEEVVDHNEMLELVHGHNYGTLGHSDAWFQLFSIDEEGNTSELKISDFYDEAEEYMKGK